MVIDWANSAYDAAKLDDPNIGELEPYKDKMIANIEIISWVFLMCTFIIGFTIMFGWCYRNSTLDRTYDRKEKLLAKKEIANSQKEVDKALQKNLDKRALYE